MVGWYWSVYAWDFETNRVVVIDPLNMKDGQVLLENKHGKTVALMHQAICDCMQMFFPDALNNISNWETEFVNSLGGHCEW